MPLLLDDDYSKLAERGIEIAEDQTQRFVLFLAVKLPPGMYVVPTCDVLVIIPPNYNQAGNDMFWTNPCLQRQDGQPIPAVLGPGGGDNRMWGGREFFRWSRHWNPPSPGLWRPGRDDIVSIHRRVLWALAHPDS